MNYVEVLRTAIVKELPNLPEDLIDLYTLIALLFGQFVCNEEIHDAWAVWQNKTNPEHKSLIPYAHLTEKIQDLDTEYTEAVLRAVDKVGRAKLQ